MLYNKQRYNLISFFAVSKINEYWRLNMRKKRFVFILFYLLLFVLFGCSSEKDYSIKQIDLRNKDTKGNVVTRNVSDEDSKDVFNVEFLRIEDYRGNVDLLSEDDIKDLLTFEDDTEGFKINFKNPEKMKDYNVDMNVCYVDDNYNASTRQILDYFWLNNYKEEEGCYVVRENVSWVFPLIIPNKKCQFLFHISFNGKNGSDDGISFMSIYEITSAHGIGIIDNLPKGFKSYEYTSVENGIFSLHDVIPVESKQVKKSINIFSSNRSEVHWDPTGQWIGALTEDITDEENSEFCMDLNKIENTSDAPYFFCQFQYQYELEGYDYCTFNTPEFLSYITENTIFSIPPEER